MPATGRPSYSAQLGAIHRENLQCEWLENINLGGLKRSESEVDTLVAKVSPQTGTDADLFVQPVQVMCDAATAKLSRLGF